MAGHTVKLYELAGQEDNRIFSPAYWRIRFACLHKGLKIESIPWRYTEKDAIKFANTSSVPVLVDEDIAMKESYDIALYLEKAFPEAPSLFGGPGGETSIKLIDKLSIYAKDLYTPGIAADMLQHLHAKDTEYFITTQEKRFGGKLDDLAKTKEERVKKFREALEPMRALLSETKFVGGSEPNYGDYCLAAGILTSRAMSKTQLLDSADPILSWLKRVLGKFEDDLKDYIWEWDLS